MYETLESNIFQHFQFPIWNWQNLSKENIFCTKMYHEFCTDFDLSLLIASRFCHCILFFLFSHKKSLLVRIIKKMLKLPLLFDALGQSEKKEREKFNPIRQDWSFHTRTKAHLKQEWIQVTIFFCENRKIKGLNMAFMIWYRLLRNNLCWYFTHLLPITWISKGFWCPVWF